MPMAHARANPFTNPIAGVVRPLSRLSSIYPTRATRARALSYSLYSRTRYSAPPYSPYCTRYGPVRSYYILTLPADGTSALSSR